MSTQIDLIREIQTLKEINQRLVDEVHFLRQRLIADERTIRSLHDDISAASRRTQTIYVERPHSYNGPDWPGVL